MAVHVKAAAHFIDQRRYRPFSPSDLLRLSGARRPVRCVPPGASLGQIGETADSLVMLISGWAFTYRLFPDGGRQIMKIELPGSLLGLSSATLTDAPWACEALTNVRFSIVSREELFAEARKQPELAFAIASEAIRNEILLRERLSDVARRSARERIANLLYELHCRLQVNRDDGEGECVSVPLTQHQIADAIGVTPIHVSRTLRAFKQAGILQYSGRQLRLLHPERLRRFSSLESDYVRWLKDPVITMSARGATERNALNGRPPDDAALEPERQMRR